MKQYFILIASALLFCTSMQASKRTVKQQRLLAQSVLGKHITTRSIKDDTLRVLEDTPQFTIVGYDRGGFVVVSDDDSCEPVLGWSTGTYAASSHSDGFIWWLKAVGQTLANNPFYTRSITPATIGDASLPSEVESFVTSTWGQEDPYNQQCPIMGGKHAVTGCVATAAAQIMYYYKYPEHGYGDKVYDSDNFEFVDFASTTYDYADMLPSYSAGYSQASADAVATLMHHCGIAAKMQYGSSSGAYSYVAANAWRDNFGYTTEYLYRGAYSDKEWMTTIYSELANHRPIQYSGEDNAVGGHSFVFDGYNADGLVHVNWGWDGAENGYYDVALLNTGNGSFSSVQDMILMHTPEAPALDYHSQWALLQQEDQKSGLEVIVDPQAKTLSFQVNMLVNVDNDSFKGYLALMARSVNDSIETPLDTFVVPGDDETSESVPTFSGYTGVTDIIDISSLPDGEYDIYMASQSISPEETEWQAVHYDDAVIGLYRLTIEDGKPVATGIDDTPVSHYTVKPSDTRIYDINGRCLGTDASKLGKGLYICNGRKFVKQ